MIQTKTRKIGEHEWQCTQWAGTKNLAVLHTLTTVLTPAIAHGAVPGKSLLSAEVNLGGAADALFRGLGTAPQFEALILTLLENTHVDGRPMNRGEFDLVFVGPKLFDLLPVLRFVLETNFGDFSQLAAGIMSLFAVVKDNAAQPAASPSV